MKERMIVVPVGNLTFSVTNLDSTKGKPSQYIVKWIGYKWVCSCPHSLDHADDPNFVCKHILAVVTAIGELVTVNKEVFYSEDYGVRVVQKGRKSALARLR